MNYPQSSAIEAIVNTSKSIVVVQADNPDADSLGSALALEEILSDLGKEVFLYCGVDMPGYLRYLQGWDRVSRDLPKNFDASIIVDNSTMLLMESLNKTNQKGWLASRPSIVVDHHDIEPTIDFAKVICSQPAAACAEVIYHIALDLKWKVNAQAAFNLIAGIMSDSLGLTTDTVSVATINTLAGLVGQGTTIAAVENARREFMRKTPEILAYKGELLKRVSYAEEGRIALISIPWEEISRYSHSYNPSMLVMDEMRLVEGVNLAIAFKTYPDGKLTAKIRCNPGFPIAGELAETFGGGGHAYAAGFKIQNASNAEEYKNKAVAIAAELLGKIKK